MNLGKFNSQNDGTLYQELAGALGGVVFSTPAWFNGSVYYGPVGDRIRALTVNAGFLFTQANSSTDNFFPHPGATPSISANGTADPILWAVENANGAISLAPGINSCPDHRRQACLRGNYEQRRCLWFNPIDS